MTNNTHNDDDGGGDGRGVVEVSIRAGSPSYLKNDLDITDEYSTVKLQCEPWGDDRYMVFLEFYRDDDRSNAFISLYHEQARELIGRLEETMRLAIQEDED